MWSEFAARIGKTETVREYGQIIDEMDLYLRRQGRKNEAEELACRATVRKNRFSGREEAEDFAAKKAAALDFCERMETYMAGTRTDRVSEVLENFDSFCRSLYKSQIHESCSAGIKAHLTDFEIKNEYDLQKLMLSALRVVFPDARTEVAQDSGHHPVRKDIVIDSAEAVIELKCTRPGMSERKLSEEVAADIIHYQCENLFFYIYDKEGIIRNADSFRNSYEDKTISAKAVRMIIYNHPDI